MSLLSRPLGHLIDCKHASQLISQLQDRQPTGWEAVRLRWHLAVCVACARFEQQVEFLRKAMRRFGS